MSLTLFDIFYATVIVFFIVNEIFQRRLGVPPTPSSPRLRRAMIELLDVRPGETIIELGSGWGGLAVRLARKHPEAHIVGLEMSLFPYMVARGRLMLHPGLKNLVFLRQDFFKYSFSKTDGVACYLTYSLMAKLREKFLQELPAGSRIVSSTFPVPDWPVEKEVPVQGLWSTRVFLYRKT